MSISNQAWILLSCLALGVAWIELAQRGRIGWAALPVFFLIFGIGVAWIRGHHRQKKNDDAS